MRTLHLVIGPVLLGSGCLTVRESGEDGGWFGGGRVENHTPVIDSVEIRPSSVYVDGPATCVASASDRDGDEVDLTYTWRNATSGQTLGTGPDIELDPDLIMPGETLKCLVTARDPEAAEAEEQASTEPVCGFYDAGSLKEVNFDIGIFFRPYITDELRPGFGGEPWDWTGDIPDWV
ncbi:MAG: hypothetical protein QGG40_13455, partial [Myxococcota bacterium]|nr:hypothetical protein [Myxococcota bacterium]